MNERNTTRDQDSTLNAYMRDVSRHSLLTKADEIALGRELHDARIRYWRSVVAYAPYTAAAVDVIAEHVEGTDALQAMFQETRDAARGARDTNRKAAADRFSRAINELAKALATIDPECLAADRLSADLALLEQRTTEGVSMTVKPPRRESRPFADHFIDVRSSAATLRHVRNRFARANLRLVVRIAHRFQRSGLTLHDRVQEGNLGLMKAIDRFDPQRGFRFSTYASWWIKHAIRRAVVNRGRTIRLPAHLQATAHKLAQTRAQLRFELNDEPSTRQLAEAMEMPLDKVEAVMDAAGQRSISLDTKFAEDDERSVGDMLADEATEDLEDLVAEAWDSQRLRGHLLHLSPMEQDILRQRFGLDGQEESTLTDIGGQYALSRERIRQLQQKALQQLRARLEPQSLEA